MNTLEKSLELQDGIYRSLRYTLDLDGNNNTFHKDIVECSKVIKTEDVFPIFVRSYKRGINAATLQLALQRQTETPVYCFVYPDDYDENYSQQYAGTNIKFVMVTTPSKGIVIKTNFMLNYALQNNIENFILSDDDVVGVHTVKNRTMDSKKHEFDPCEVRGKRADIGLDEYARIWTYLYHCQQNTTGQTIVMSGALHAGSSMIGANVAKARLHPWKNIGKHTQMVHINVKQLAKLKIKYDYGYNGIPIWEDYSITLDVMMHENHICPVYECLNFDTVTMSSGTVMTEDNSQLKKYIDFSYGTLLKHTGRYFALYEKYPGVPNTKHRWANIKYDIRMFGRLLTHDECIAQNKIDGRDKQKITFKDILGEAYDTYFDGGVSF